MAKRIKSVQESKIGNLTNDVLLQVLSSVSPETLLTLKCVSKQWRDLISDPWFVNLQHNQSKENTLMLEVESTNGLGTYKITLIDPLDTFSIKKYSITFPRDSYKVCYCSGLLLFYGMNAYIHVYNPTTRECFTTKHNLLCELQSYLYANYPFICPSIQYSNSFTCFGFLPSTSQHKFVDLFAILCINKNNADMLLSKALVVTLPNKSFAGSWKYIRVDCLDYINSVPNQNFEAICVSGIMYWLIVPHDTFYTMDLRKFLTFDLQTEEFRVITCPLRYIQSYSEYFLVELKREVCLVDMFLDKHVLDIWVLKDYKNEIWAKGYNIDYSTMDGFDQKEFTRLHKHERLITLLQVVVDDDGDKAILIKSYDGSFHCYYLKAKIFIKLGEYKEDNLKRRFVHHASLVPVPSGRLSMITSEEETLKLFP